jgi:hypothetical protein
MKKYFLLSIMVAACMAINAKSQMKYYLFVYFTGNAPEQEQVCYATSADGFNYTPINGGKPVIGSDTIAVSKGVRDPHILRGKDGWFYMVATDMRCSLGWDSNRGIVLMRSRDMINWEHHTVNFTTRFAGSNFANVTRVWAPQIIYDAKAGKYIVYFSLLTNDGTIPYDRVYWAYANKDFSDLESKPEVLYDYGQASIDTDIAIDDSGTYHLYFKTEGAKKKGIRQYTFTDIHKFSEWKLLPGTFEQTKEDVEGVGLFPLIKGGWCMMYDCYRNHHYQFCKSKDLYNFEFVANTETKGAFTPRHGTVMQITKKEYKRLINRYNK